MVDINEARKKAIERALRRKELAETPGQAGDQNKDEARIKAYHRAQERMKALGAQAETLEEAERTAKIRDMVETAGRRLYLGRTARARAILLADHVASQTFMGRDKLTPEQFKALNNSFTNRDLPIYDHVKDVEDRLRLFYTGLRRYYQEFMTIYVELNYLAILYGTYRDINGLTLKARGKLMALEGNVRLPEDLRLNIKEVMQDLQRGRNNIIISAKTARVFYLDKKKELSEDLPSLQFLIDHIITRANDLKKRLAIIKAGITEARAYMGRTRTRIKSYEEVFDITEDDLRERADLSKLPIINIMGDEPEYDLREYLPKIDYNTLEPDPDTTDAYRNGTFYHEQYDKEEN